MKGRITSAVAAPMIIALLGAQFLRQPFEKIESMRSYEIGLALIYFAPVSSIYVLLGKHENEGERP